MEFGMKFEEGELFTQITWDMDVVGVARNQGPWDTCKYYAFLGALESRTRILYQRAGLPSPPPIRPIQSVQELIDRFGQGGPLDPFLNYISDNGTLLEEHYPYRNGSPGPLIETNEMRERNNGYDVLIPGRDGINRIYQALQQDGPLFAYFWNTSKFQTSFENGSMYDGTGEPNIIMVNGTARPDYHCVEITGRGIIKHHNIPYLVYKNSRGRFAGGLRNGFGYIAEHVVQGYIVPL